MDYFRYRRYRVSLLSATVVEDRPGGSVRYGRKAFTFRGLTAGEYGRSEDMDEFEAQGFILAHCIEDVNDWGTELAGTCTKLIELILHASGLDADAITAYDAQAWWDSAKGKMEWMCVTFLPNCNFEVLYNCDPFHYSRYLMSGQLAFELNTQKDAKEFIDGVPANKHTGNPIGEALPSDIQEAMNDPTDTAGGPPPETENFGWSKKK